MMTMMTTGRRRVRKGLTLIETMIALAILAGAMLGMGFFVTRLSHTAGTGMVSSTADDLAVARLEQIKAYPTYSKIDSVFVGTESSIAGYPGFTRQTYITHTVTSTSDYKTITVKVTSSALSAPVKKTSVVTAS